MLQVDASHCLELLHCQMGCTAVADRTIVQRAGLGFGQRDEFAEAVHRQARIDRQHIGRRGNQRHRRQLLHRVIAQPGGGVWG